MHRIRCQHEPLPICCCLQVLFNYRADRMVEISKAFEYEDFDAFDRVRYPKVRLDPLVDGRMWDCVHCCSLAFKGSLTCGELRLRQADFLIV